MIKFKTTFSFFYQWHQRIGLFMCIAIISWALSGLAHPIISRLNPKPAAPPPAEVLDISALADFSQLVAQQGIQTLKQVRLFQWENQPVYRIAHESGISYFSATTLQEMELGDFEYAVFLARHYLGDATADITNAQLIHEFNQEYLYINRFLPVVRIDFARADSSRVYIDPAQGRLATIDNNRKVITGTFFRALHSWTWMENIVLRKSLMAIFLICGFTTALFGLTVYIKSWRMGIFRKDVSAHQHHAFSRRLHRSLGATVALFAMTFTASGLLHLLLTDKTDAAQPWLNTSISSQGISLHHERIRAELDEKNIEDIQLVKIDSAAYWRIKLFKHQAAHGEHDHHAANQLQAADALIYIDAHSGNILENGAQEHAKYLARSLSSHPAEKIASVELVEMFGGEYGFINKRLPVHAVHFDLPGQPTLYIETATNTLASEVTNSARFEGYTFAWLHKWHFIDFLGKNIRDLVTSTIALSIIAVLLLGIYRFIVTRRKQAKRR
jgi:hypothetical protein